MVKNKLKKQIKNILEMNCELYQKVKTLEEEIFSYQNNTYDEKINIADLEFIEIVKLVENYNVTKDENIRDELIENYIILLKDI